MTIPGPQAPLAAVVQLGHAAVQRVADLSRTDVLHIKGYAIDPSLTWEGRVGTDVDVLVRPDQVRDFLQRLVEAGWQRVIGFRAGSPFGHAATLWHPSWGYVDVHRLFPGIGIEPAEAFEVLWTDRGQREIAGIACPVPSLVGQTAILVLNAARTRTSAGSAAGNLASDVDTSWSQADDARRAEVVSLVGRLGAEVAFAAATGHLEDFRDRREYALWKVVSRGGTRLEEWRARIAAAPSRGEQFRLVLTAPLVNVEHLTALWGRRPTRWEIVREFFMRPVRGVAEQVRVILRRRKTGHA